MLGSDIRKLIGKFNDHSTSLLDQAAGFCLTRTHYNICIEHFLLKALEDGRGDIIEIIGRYDIDAGQLQKSLLASLEDFKDGNNSKPSFSPVFLEQIEQAWTFASIDLDERSIRSGHLLYALAKQKGYLSTHDYGRILDKINLQQLGSQFHDITQNSTESKKVVAPRVGDAGRWTFQRKATSVSTQVT